ncbi:complement factor H-like [Emydura macquarii macquarii]|uniref:complement factor H-like n=1 Tax=Emydura macquarii macquarii TaxID=1129001 RepID=UPI00352AB750
MTLLSCIIMQLLWAFCAKGQVKPCDYPHIKNGRLTGYFKNYREQAFPVHLGVNIFYRCFDGYVSVSENTWNPIRCTADGWDPIPKCLRTCSPTQLANGRFLNLLQKYYKEGDEISYVCDHEYIPANQQAKVTCTKDDWMPTPRCIFNRFQGKMGWTLLPREPEDVSIPAIESLTRIYDPPLLPGAGLSGSPQAGSLKLPELCERTEVPHGYFYETKNRFDLNEKATYRCQIDYTTPEGNETGEIQCLEEGWSPFPECIKTCRRPAFEHIHFHTSKAVFLPENILEYECAGGYQTVNKISIGHTVCGINGWTPEPQCLAIECEMLMLPHGEVFPKEDKYLDGDVVTFSCANRYTRVGPDSAQCYYFGWSPAPPTCKVEIKACGPPSSIINGNIISELHEKYQHGDSVEYDCNLRFKMIGSKNIECIDGEWSSSPSCIEEEKTCVRPPSIVKGGAINVNQNQYFHGDSVEYGCEGNLEIVGTNTIKCLSGEWTSLPSCADPSVLCVIPRNLENIRFLSIYNWQKNFYHKDVVRYRCNSDVKKLKQTVCEYGKWSPKPECIENKRKCPPPPQLPGSSKITEKRSYEIGEKITFVCLQNFKLHGMKEIMCEDGKWQSPPRCVEEKSCLQPYPTENGEILSLENQSLRIEKPGPVTYPNGTTLKYSCNAGFVLRGPSEVTCNMEKWTSSPACIEMPCRDAPNVPHAWAEGSIKANYEPGETVRYQCHPGFIAVGSQDVTCRRGQWTQLPKCQDATCGDPPAIPNADIIDLRDRRYWPAERVQYQCREGFESRGLNDVTCINREWSQPPTCEDMMCGPAPAVLNGQILGHGKQKYLPGERVRYRCQQGLSLIGSQTVTCQKKKWSEPPECREAGGKCGPPPYIDNGDIVSFPLKQYISNSTVEYKCKSLHILEGSQSVRCDSGQWTDPPVCLEPCTATPEDMERNNIQLRWTYEKKLYVLPGDFVQFVCKRGYKLDPISSGLRVQCLDGRLEYPKCKRRKGQKDMKDELESDKLKEEQNSMSAIASAGFTFSSTSMTLLRCVVLQIIWAFCAKGEVPVCEQPPDVDFGEIISGKQSQYVESDTVQYGCYPGYTLAGSERITCDGRNWMPPPKCLAPCTITKQQLEDKKLLLSSGRRRTVIIPNDQVVEFFCSEGYNPTVPSARKCLDGHIDFPLCISETGKKCGRPPVVANGDITTFLQKEYAAGSAVEYKCQKFYTIKGQNKSFCNNGNWTETPVCEEPCVLSQEEMLSRGIELSERYNGKQYIQRGDFVVFKCKSGLGLQAFLSPDFTVQCNSGNIVYPQCNKDVLGRCGSPPSIQNGNIISDLLPVYASGSSVEYKCQSLHTMTGSKTITCRLGKWTAPPVCTETAVKCGPPPAIDNGETLAWRLSDYKSGSRVEYQCKHLHVMKGSAFVRCQFGRWTDPPVCLEPCTTSPEDIEKNNIQLKWRSETRLYIKSGSFVEFACKTGYERDPTSSAFRVQCVEGKLAYPKCKIRVACTTSPEDMQKNNINLKWSSETRMHLESGSFVEFDCKNGYERDPTSSAFRVQCVEGKLAYPKCKIRESCNISPEDMKKTNIQLKWSSETRLYLASGNFVEFDCKNGYERDPTSSAFRVQCVKGKLAFPKCKRKGIFG